MTVTQPVRVRVPQPVVVSVPQPIYVGGGGSGSGAELGGVFGTSGFGTGGFEAGDHGISTVYDSFGHSLPGSYGGSYKH